MKRFKLARCYVSMLFAFTLLFSLHLSCVHAQDFASKLADQFLKKIPVTEVDPAMTMEQGIAVQEKFVALIAKEFGEPVGYKAGLTNPNAQKAFGVSHPVRGTLLKKMMLKSGATIEANFGARALSEGDLLVRVGNEAINQAKTPEDTLKNLDVVIPFIELPDLVFDPKVKMSGPAIAAINVGARFGVMGEPIPLAATPEWMNRLRNFTLQVYDEKGAMVTEGKGTALLGDPLNVVLWIKDSLVAEGKQLKKGDLLSLGTIGKMMPAKPGTTVRAKYIDLDPKGPVEISVTFK
ncbi:MAG: hydratase [Proteobacteria bacterium]|nr:hydratase [Pseudomonadota bacterium]